MIETWPHSYSQIPPAASLTRSHVRLTADGRQRQSATNKTTRSTLHAGSQSPAREFKPKISPIRLKLLSVNPINLLA